MELKFQNDLSYILSDSLLIVPYGIEILPTSVVPVEVKLLIVPYGIEMY